MTPAPSPQASLFDRLVQVDRSTATAPAGRPYDGTRLAPSGPLDDTASRLRDLVSALRRASDPVDRIRLGLELRAAAERLVTSAMNDARHEGHTWRDLGARLGVPFQTLFRRYGSPGSDAPASTAHEDDHGPDGSAIGKGDEP